MASIATTSFPRTAPTPSTRCALRSVEGHVLPHLVDVDARAHGRVRVPAKALGPGTPVAVELGP